MKRCSRTPIEDMSAMSVLDRKDLELLMGLEPKALWGQILQWNHEPRYLNRLDAIQLVACISELQLIKKPKT